MKSMSRQRYLLFSLHLAIYVKNNDYKDMNYLVVSYNQPKLSPFASWSANAITFAANPTVGLDLYGVFVDTNNTIYVADRSNNRIRVWNNGSINSTKVIYGNLITPLAIFVSISGDIYVDSYFSNIGISRLTANRNGSVPVMYNTGGECGGIFVDTLNNLYLSVRDMNRVIRKSLSSISNITTIVAGTGCNGSTSATLYQPYGIFVDTNFDLYVADSGNNRIQLFRSEKLDAITVAGSGSANATITLNYPSGVMSGC